MTSNPPITFQALSMHTLRNSLENDMSLFMCVLCHFSCMQLFATLWTVVSYAPPSMGFFRQEYWSGLPCPPQLSLLKSPALAGRFFTSSATYLFNVYFKRSSSKIGTISLSFSKDMIFNSKLKMYRSSDNTFIYFLPGCPRGNGASQVQSLGREDPLEE